MSAAKPIESFSPEESERLRQAIHGHYRSIGRLLRHLGVLEADVDDALQQTYLTLAQKLHAVEPGKERAFMAGVATRVAARIRRRAGRAREQVSDQLDQLSSGASPEAEVERQRQLARFDAALDAMSDPIRQVVVLFEVEEMTLTEIAQLLGVPRGTVASRLRLGRAVFRERLGRHG